MFDFERVQLQIREYYFKLFRHYNKPEEIRYFVQRWLDIIRSYSEHKEFIAFDPPLPVLKRLVPRAQAVILVPFPNIQVRLRLGPYTSIFPYFPFRVKKVLHDETCRTELQFFNLYLDITGIRTVCLYNFFHHQERNIMVELQKNYPDIEVYGKGSYDCFMRKIHSRTGSLKSQSRLKALRDTPSRQVVPRSSPTDSDNLESCSSCACPAERP